MTKVSRKVQDMVRNTLGDCPYGVGDVVRINGQPCKITSGQYWGEYGLFNFWIWREVFPSGSLGERKAGYGGDWKVIHKKGARRAKIVKSVSGST